MSKAARTVLIFGIYAVVVGLAMIVLPEELLAAARLPQVHAGWARVIGLMALVIGTYDIACARADYLVFLRVSVFTRTGFAIGAAVLVVAGSMPAAFLVPAAVDACGALWTALALKQSPPTSVLR